MGYRCIYIEGSTKPTIFNLPFCTANGVLTEGTSAMCRFIASRIEVVYAETVWYKGTQENKSLR